MPVWSLISGIPRPSVTCAWSLLGPRPDLRAAGWTTVGQDRRGVHLDQTYLCLCICIPKCGHAAMWARVCGLWPTQQRKRESLGERSEEEGRLKENTHRTHWLNMIRGTHMVQLRKNQMPSDVLMKRKLNVNTSPQYGLCMHYIYFSDKLQLKVNIILFI